jgi:hypothetical protein
MPPPDAARAPPRHDRRLLYPRIEQLGEHREEKAMVVFLVFFGDADSAQPEQPA